MSTGKTPRQLLFGYYGFKDRSINMSCRVNYEKTAIVERMKPWCSTEVFLMTQVLRLGDSGTSL
nr:unnamed protein product [Callosobruchus analis]